MAKGNFLFLLIGFSAFLLFFMLTLGAMQASTPQEDVYIVEGSAVNQSGQFILSTGIVGLNIMNPFLLFIAAIVILSFLIILFGRRF